MEYRFLGCPVSFYMVLKYLYSLNNPPYYCTITVILTPAHVINHDWDIIPEPHITPVQPLHVPK